MLIRFAWWYILHSIGNKYVSSSDAKTNKQTRIKTLQNIWWAADDAANYNCCYLGRCCFFSLTVWLFSMCVKSFHKLIQKGKKINWVKNALEILLHDSRVLSFGNSLINNKNIFMHFWLAIAEFNVRFWIKFYSVLKFRICNGKLPNTTGIFLTK